MNYHIILSVTIIPIYPILKTLNQYLEFFFKAFLKLTDVLIFHNSQIIYWEFCNILLKFNTSYNPVICIFKIVF